MINLKRHPVLISKQRDCWRNYDRIACEATSVFVFGEWEISVTIVSQDLSFFHAGISGKFAPERFRHLEIEAEKPLSRRLLEALRKWQPTLNFGWIAHKEITQCSFSKQIPPCSLSEALRQAINIVKLLEKA